MKTKLFNLFIIALLAFGFVSAGCQKEEDPLPYAIVNIRIEPNSTMFINLNTVGGYEYLTAEYPSRGIIVYRISNVDFVAFERTCPHDPDACCTEEDACSRLVVDEGGLLISDACCESTYLILDGSNVEGPSVKPLKQYNTSYDGKTLHIFN